MGNSLSAYVENYKHGKWRFAGHGGMTIHINTHRHIHIHINIHIIINDTLSAISDSRLCCLRICVCVNKTQLTSSMAGEGCEHNC